VAGALLDAFTKRWTRARADDRIPLSFARSGPNLLRQRLAAGDQGKPIRLLASLEALPCELPSSPRTIGPSGCSIATSFAP